MSDDLYLDHNGLQTAYEEMGRANSKMLSSMDDLMAMLQPLSASFTGHTAEAWGAIQSNHNTLARQLTRAFQGGAVVLQNMHENLVDADKRAAGGMGI